MGRYCRIYQRTAKDYQTAHMTSVWRNIFTVPRIKLSHFKMLFSLISSRSVTDMANCFSIDFLLVICDTKATVRQQKQRNRFPEKSLYKENWINLKRYPLYIKGSWYTYRGGNSIKIALFPFWKSVYSKRKEFAPHGSKFFPSRIDPISEGAWCAGKQTQYKNTPIQIKNSPPKTEISDKKKTLIFSYFFSKHWLWALVRTALAKRF